jgi:hypothetical protein
MRLGQLSRKLGISTSQIISYLASKDIVIGEDSNTKIEDEHANWVTQTYAPHLLTDVAHTISEEKIQTTEPIAEPVEIIESESVSDLIIEPTINANEPLPELIKAPKIELSGLKVLGKIELPEKKKKEGLIEGAASENLPDDERKIRSDRKPAGRKEYEERPRKNPVTIQREREEREAEKRRKEELLRAKEKKAQHYQNKVKIQVASKRIKMIEEAVEEIDSPIEEIPTTWWGKFKKWLRT